MSQDVQKKISLVEQRLANDEHWKEISDPNRNWEDDPLFSTYHACSTKAKGVMGEAYVEAFMVEQNHPVSDPLHTDHDRIISGFKTEIKFSLAKTKTKKGTKVISPNDFMINHVSKGKDWDRLIFCGINPVGSDQRAVMLFAEKKDIIKEIDRHGSFFRHQQAGKKGENDDYICPVTSKVLAAPFWKEMSEW